MEWRREYKPELIKESDVSIEAETGKMLVFGCLVQDNTGIVLTHAIPSLYSPAY